MGKGFTGTCLKEAHPEVKVISTGQLARDERGRNRQFDEQYGPIMDRGDRLDKDVMDRLFHQALCESRSSDLIIDGYIRSIAQVEESMRLGLLGPNAIVFDLKAKHKTCIKRFGHRMTKEGRSDDQAGAETFNHRYELHENTVGGILSVIGETDATVVTIDADIDLHIFASRILGHWARFTRRRMLPRSNGVPLSVSKA